jgi:hypothetical protein
VITASCHCGAVRMEIAEPPATVTDCNCSICRRLGALWAYYHPNQVKFLTDGMTVAYVWGDRMLEFHHCTICGCTTHWEAIDKAGADRMGINARLMEDFDRLAVRSFDGAAV